MQTNNQHDDEAAFEAAKAKYHKDWSDPSMPIINIEDDAYKAGWFDGLQYARQQRDGEVADLLEAAAKIPIPKHENGCRPSEGQCVAACEANKAAWREFTLKSEALSQGERK